MLDLKFIRRNAELVKEGARKKRVDCDVDGLLRLDEQRRALGTRVDELRARQKSAGKETSRPSDVRKAKPKLVGPAARAARGMVAAPFVFG